MSLPIPKGANPLELLGEIKQDLKSALRYLIIWLALLLFDYCATLPKEIQYIWKAKLSTLKVLFLLLRYWTIVNQIVSSVLILYNIPSEICAFMYRFETWGGLLVIFLSSLILSLRVFSICEKSRTIGAVLAVLLVVDLGWMIGSTTQLVALKLPSFIADIIGFHGCLAVGGVGFRDSIASSFWAAPLLFDTVILSITLHKILSTQRHAGGSIPILQRVLKSNILYFAALATTNLVSVAMSAQSRATLKSFNSPASLALTGIMTCRLVLVLFEPSDPNSPYSKSSDSTKFPFSFRSRSNRRGSHSKAPPARVNPRSGEVGETGEGGGDVELERVRGDSEPRYPQASIGSRNSGNTLEIVAPPPSPRIRASSPSFPFPPQPSPLHLPNTEILAESTKSRSVYPPPSISPSPLTPTSSHFSDDVESPRPSFGSNQRGFA